MSCTEKFIYVFCKSGFLCINTAEYRNCPKNFLFSSSMETSLQVFRRSDYRLQLRIHVLHLKILLVWKEIPQKWRCFSVHAMRFVFSGSDSDADEDSTSCLPPLSQQCKKEFPEMDVPSFSETLLLVYKFILRKIPEDSTLYTAFPL